MKILIVPSVTESDRSSMRALTQSLADLFRMHGHEPAVCAPEDFGISRVEFYSAPTPKQGLIRKWKERQNRTLEEYLYNRGALDKNYLKADTETLTSAIDSFKADLLLDLGRPSAIIAAEVTQVRCFTFVHAAMVRTRAIPAQCMQGINETLNDYGLDQILRIQDLLLKAERRIVFGPEYIQPFPSNFPCTRLGSMSLLPLVYTPTKKVSIVLTDTNTKTSYLNKVVKQAFLGAPYEADIAIGGIAQSSLENLHYNSDFKLNDLNDAGVCIHDGSDPVFNYCLTLGIPQLIINDTSWRRSWNAAAGAKNGVALVIPEIELDMAKLYETYRQLKADDYYKIRCAHVAKDVQALGGLNEILKLL